MNMIHYKELSFEVRRSSKRRTVGITIERDGQLVITAPQETPLESLETVIHNRRLWIYKHLLYKDSLNPRTTAKEYISGEGFSYLGRNYRLKLIVDLENQPLLKYFQGNFLLQRSAQSQGKELFIQWYRSRLKPYLEKKVFSFGDRIGSAPQDIQVRELGNRWGSCNAKGDLYFHWRVALLPSNIIDYIVIHEMVHLLERCHNDLFWERIERILPDYQTRKYWLASEGIKYNL